jgi:Flp pilus assembly pilin Flp
MFEIIKTLIALKSDRRAVTALEYGLIAGVLVATVAVGFNTLGGGISAAFTSVAAAL